MTFLRRRDELLPAVVDDPPREHQVPGKIAFAGVLGAQVSIDVLYVHKDRVVLRFDGRNYEVREGDTLLMDLRAEVRPD